MNLTYSLLLAVGLDYLLAEPSNRYHPLVGFGRYVHWLEQHFLDLAQVDNKQRYAGIGAWLLALLPSGLIILLPELWWLNGVVLYVCIAPRSLQLHADAVFAALQNDDLALARQRVGYIVSRQTENLNEQQVRMATIESVLENGADAVFAPLFWFVLLGPFGAVLYRFSNTLDAMWGYKNDRYRQFGWAAARWDDLLNFIPARLTALGYALCGKTRSALKAWQHQAHWLESPNAGPVMVSGGAALDVQLGGPACYHGQIKQKPYFGGEQVAINQDIVRSYRLVYQVVALWLGLSIVWEII